MDLLKLSEEFLEENNMRYLKSGDSFKMTLCGGLRKWSAVISTDEKGFFIYCARYPWRVPECRESYVQAALGRMNLTLRAGCFMISEGYAIFRYGVYIFDEFTAKESMGKAFSAAIARTEAAWDSVYRAVCCSEVNDAF